MEVYMNETLAAEELTDIYNRPRVSWGAIFAGWVLSFAIAILLYIFGTAVGFTAADAADTINKGIPLATGVWMLFSWAISLYLGGMFASRLAGTVASDTGIFHGMAVWAVACVLAVMLGMFSPMQAGLTMSQGLLTGSSIAAGTHNAN